MSAIPYESREEEWDGYEDEGQSSLPGRPRRKWFTRGSAVLAAVLLGVVGFYVGVRVEKGQVSNSSTTSGSSGLSALASRLGAGTGAAGTSDAATAGRSGTGGFAGAGAGGFAGALGGGGANATFGSVASVSGNTIYVTSSSGNTVKVKLVSATKVTKNVGVSKSKIRPGDTVVVQGLKQSGATITAASVSDSGARTTGSTTGGSGTGSGGSSGSSGVSSLFGGG